MEVSETSAPAETLYKGKTYFFCSPDCKDEFEEDPEEYIGTAA